MLVGILYLQCLGFNVFLKPNLNSQFPLSFAVILLLSSCIVIELLHPFRTLTQF